MDDYFKGLPTDIELRKLKEEYPFDDLFEGQVFSYKEIEQLLNLKWGTSRWQSVTNRWRRTVEREVGKMIVPIPGAKQFKILDDPGKVEYSGKRQIEAKNKTVKSIKALALVDRAALPEELLPEYDFKLKRAAQWKAMLQLKRQLPKPEL
jgi:hypothetical protein